MNYILKKDIPTHKAGSEWKKSGSWITPRDVSTSDANFFYSEIKDFDEWFEPVEEETDQEKIIRLDWENKDQQKTIEGLRYLYPREIARLKKEFAEEKAKNNDLEKKLTPIFDQWTLGNEPPFPMPNRESI